MASPVRYTLADINGELHVRCETTMHDEPVWVANYWPTGRHTRDLTELWELTVDQLATVEVVNHYPGEFYVRSPKSWGPPGFALTLVNGGRAASVKTESRPCDPPKTRCRVEFRVGQWWKYLSKGGWTAA